MRIESVRSRNVSGTSTSRGAPSAGVVASSDSTALAAVAAERLITLWAASESRVSA